MQNMEDNERFNEMQRLKRRLFAMRNGVVADALRKGGCKFRIIFGVNLPQLSEIAADWEASAGFAEKLWANTTTRESMLIAPMLMPPEAMDEERVKRWVRDVPSTEVADVLCHRLLKYLPDAPSVAEDLYENAETGMERYTAVRLMFNLVYKHPARAKAMAEKEALCECPLTQRVSQMLAEEAGYVLRPETSSE